MAPRNASRIGKLSFWKNNVISIPRAESVDVFQKYLTRQNNVKKPRSPDQFETNRRTVLPKISKRPASLSSTQTTNSSRTSRSNRTKNSSVDLPQKSTSKKPPLRQQLSTTNIDPLVRLSRRETFSSSHRLHNPKLSNQQNARIYDKCNHLHGHNYVVYVILRGPIDKQTGMVYNIADLKKELGDVLDTLDHKNLDEDVDFFKHHVSTVENIALYIATTLELSQPELLYKIKVCETEKNTASVYLNA
ncbi:6-pyruvoyl tetrahydrobiopterin synthase [Aphelenchoides bicaudatus]|nr:6-pyruvoyl tetrahydrobiopterin synthase [Aphelenchoides bicaudatus]